MGKMCNDVASPQIKITSNYGSFCKNRVCRMQQPPFLNQKIVPRFKNKIKHYAQIKDNVFSRVPPVNHSN
jgi:hypothetical protein